MMNYAMMKQFCALEKGGRMAVLVGDIKKKGQLYSMPLELVKPGTLENIIIKTQHNCFSDQVSYSGRFIPILHEYVVIVRKDAPLLYPILMARTQMVDIRDMPGATWRDVVAAVLEPCKEAVSLSYIYSQIEPHKKHRKSVVAGESATDTAVQPEAFYPCRQRNVGAESGVIVLSMRLSVFAGSLYSLQQNVYRECLINNFP